MSSHSTHNHSKEASNLYKTFGESARLFQPPLTPFNGSVRLLISGGSESGKSTLWKDLFKHGLFGAIKYRQIIYCNPYISAQPMNGKTQKYLESLREAVAPAQLLLYDYIPTVPELLTMARALEGTEDRIQICLDDFGSAIFNSPSVHFLYTRGSNHDALDVVGILQNLYAANTLYYMDCRRSLSHYLIMDNAQDRALVSQLNRMIFPHQNHLPRCMKMARFLMQNERPYILIICCPQNPLADSFQCVTNLVPNPKLPPPLREGSIWLPNPIQDLTDIHTYFS